ncbi:Protein-glutamate methylesterase [Granulibacter bethesdensis]|uniref:Protein-glutamate methylesterase n=1 Tax=Granulibacter bethesdensis TaxID=364410 RepID=A0AAC9KAX3_9PROT|nr:chemotaxis protein CheB [Granulibacter bethesdensis]APH54414.1 Protein-glutamate methylesterase [Granulibacter bethesdensis]APH61999.1 Protein-glutamate methylesterase [Granulibacter bethesdensis]
MHDNSLAADRKENKNQAASFPVVGIGASAGGLEALRDMLSTATLPTGMSYVVIQHLDPNHESMLAQLLDRNTALKVIQCEGGEKIETDIVYIIPPGHGLVIRSGVLELIQFQQPRGLRRPIDDFFLSLASDQQANAVCVILSGTGGDGTTGLRAIKENGGICVVQQPETARYDGMPLSAVGTGLVDFICPACEILNCIKSFFKRRMTDQLDVETAIVADHVDELCRVLRANTGHDFAGYKRSTLIRRVERRMHVLGINSGRAYVNRIRDDSVEREALFRDLLINVTRFFRDPEAFLALRSKVIEPLLRERAADEDIRIWIPGCSSGEEAYTIAILCAEAARTTGQPLAVQIFATDIDEQMLSIAREGSYPASALIDIPVDLRERYTVPHAERFSIISPIRDMIRFSNHSLIKDPPFSRIDLVSCRNLLIYFADRLQQTVIPLLHYAIRAGGYLFLGPSESVGRFEHLFPTIDQHAHIFTRPPGAPNYPIDLPVNLRQRSSMRERGGKGNTSALGNESAAIRRLVERYAPPSLVVDPDGGILAAYGKLSRYFEFPVTRTGGSSALNLARPGLRDVMGALLRQGRDQKRNVVVRDVAVETDFGTQPVEVTCDPLSDGCLLFVIRDSGPFKPLEDSEVYEIQVADDHREALEDELRLTRYRLRSVVEELETANEELKSSNEEMMSMNEELQSTNEELATVNDELKSKVHQLTVANSDLRNFFESTDLAVVVLDADLKVRSYTEAATRIFPLKPSDRGRPLTDVTSRLATIEYFEDARAVACGAESVQRRVTTQDGKRIYSMRVLPYNTHKGTVDGATLVLTDITDALVMERQLAAERERLDIAIKAAGIGIWEYCPETGETVIDEVEQKLFDIDEEEGRQISSLLERIHPDDIRGVETALRRASAGNCDYEASFRIRTKDDTERWIKGFGRIVTGSSPTRLVGVSIDVTPEYTLAETRHLMLREMNHRVKNLFAVIAGIVTAVSRGHDNVQTFARDIRDRIASLGNAHSLAASGGEPKAIDLQELVEVTLAPYRHDTKIDIHGPSTQIDRSALSSFALILHEWATNAVKYGALDGKDGASLVVTWKRSEDGLQLIWNEQQVKPVIEPEKRGFGSLLVETSVRQLRGQIERSMNESNLFITLQLPNGVLSNG